MAGKDTIKRKPVLKDSFKKASAPPPSATRGQGDMGIKVKATTGKIDTEKVKYASRGIPGMRTAGGADQWHTGGTAYNSAYRSSYANSGNSAGAFGDVPLYFALMNENNGGILYWPVNLKEKYEWYRYFYRTDPFVGGAIDLHVELPLSKLILKMPKMQDKKKRKKIEKKFEMMCKNIKLFDKLQSILFEYLIIGNVYNFMEWDDNSKEWKKIIILPPEEVNVFRYPFSDHSRIEYKPELLMAIIEKLKGTSCNLSNKDELLLHLDEEEVGAIKHIPVDILKHIQENDAIVMDTDPYSGDGDSEVGSYVYHLARRRSEYNDLGISILERVLIPMLMKEHYRYTQLSLASRNMTPRNKISAPQVQPEELDNLREQVDLSMLDPDYSIVTNYDWSWEQIGADQRLIDLQREYEVIENQLFAGLGVTRELLTGEGMYSGGRITIEIMNTRYMLMREVLKEMVEENMIKPVAVANDFYEEDEDGIKTYIYPTLSFSRLSIRDNAEVFDSLFQLYQKGSLPIDTILELFNIDSDDNHEQLQKDLYTIKDSVYNDMLRNVYSAIGDEVVAKSDVAKRVIEHMLGPDDKPLVYNEGGGEEDGGDSWGGEDSGGWGDESTTEDTSTEEAPSETTDEHPLDEDSELEELANGIVEDIKPKLPENVTEEQIDQALGALKG